MILNGPVFPGRTSPIKTMVSTGNDMEGLELPSALTFTQYADD